MDSFTNMRMLRRFLPFYELVIGVASLGIILAAILAMVIVAEPADAQNVNERIERIEQHMQENRDLIRATETNVGILHEQIGTIQALDIQRRLTRVEVMTETNQKFLLGIAGAVALQVIELVIRVVARAREGRAEPRGA